MYHRVVTIEALVVIVGNEHGDPSSILDEAVGISHQANTFGKSIRTQCSKNQLQSSNDQNY